MSPILLGIAGAAGRMGRRLIALAAEQPDIFALASALDAPNCPDLGQDAGTLAGLAPNGIALTSTLTGTPQVIIDFSVPAATRILLGHCLDRRIALLIGTTGLTADDHALIDQAAHTIPVLQAANTSLGINLLLAVSAQIARQLGPAYDIEIVEAHHNQKKDAPSGTALALAESICKATNHTFDRDLVHGRHSVGGADAKRVPGTIGMHALRMGDVVGEHTVHYATAGERIELKHIATTRDTFARGALRAAQFLAQARPGRYTMANVLGL
jgi:4-hydroxy-tetrahydrodipicolinate reductase